MTGWACFSLILSLVIALRAIQNLKNLSRSLRWLQRKVDINDKSRTKFFICIPALDEQDTIIDTINSFIAQSYSKNLVSIYIVTTAREKIYKKKITTKHTVEQYLKTLSKDDAGRVHILHYPDKNGRMAHQINYAAEHLTTELQQKDSYFVIYNADSQIHGNTLKLANDVIVGAPKPPTILQQSAVYKYSGKSVFAEGAGLHQTLWTLVHEIPKLLSQSSRVLRLEKSHVTMIQLLKYSRIAHCVGHGLFVRGDYYQSHPLPQDLLNEDMPYGLQACALHEPIYSIPSLELASTPAKLVSVYRQKSVWFNPFFEFLDYGKSLIRQNVCFSKSEVWWLLLQAYIPLIIWLVHSIVLMGGLIVSILSGWEYIIVWLIAFALYWLLPSFVVTKKRHGLANGGFNTYTSILAGIPYVLTHSMGPFISVWRWFIAGAHNRLPDKPKTETA